MTFRTKLITSPLKQLFFLQRSLTKTVRLDETRDNEDMPPITRSAKKKKMRSRRDQYAPHLSPLQYAVASEGRFEDVPDHCVVTGGTGFVGQRLVEMLIERGAKRVVSFDIVPPNKTAWTHPNIEYIVGDLTDKAAVIDACEGADCVWHIAACVGPFHPKPLYMKVNYGGTLNVIEACKVHNVPKLVMSSSPSTRMNGSDIDGLTEAQLPKLPMPYYLQEYAKTKALGEMACTRANSDKLLTCAIAPHQVYGPRDNLFLPNVLEAAGSGKLRVFAKASTGYGYNKVCFTHVDNYCHGLILAERELKRGSPVAGNFYIVTDAHTHTHKAVRPARVLSSSSNGSFECSHEPHRTIRRFPGLRIYVEGNRSCLRCDGIRLDI